MEYGDFPLSPPPFFSLRITQSEMPNEKAGEYEPFTFEMIKSGNEQPNVFSHPENEVDRRIVERSIESFKKSIEGVHTALRQIDERISKRILDERENFNSPRANEIFYSVYPVNWKKLEKK